MDRATFQHLQDRANQEDCADVEHIVFTNWNLSQVDSTPDADPDCSVLSWGGVESEVCCQADLSSDTCLWVAARNDLSMGYPLEVVFSARPDRGVVRFKEKRPSATRWNDRFRLRWKRPRRPGIDTVESPAQLTKDPQVTAGYSVFVVTGTVGPEIRMAGDPQGAPGRRGLGEPFALQVEVEASRVQ